MADRPVIFISATSDLRSARDLVGKVLYSMGYEPVWQEIAPTDGGELLDVLRRRIAPAALVVQLVGRRYGAEPPRPTAGFGRVSYTQFEALEANRTGKKVIYYFLDDKYPTDTIDPEPAELTSLQAAYRKRLIDANVLRQDKIGSPGDLDLSLRRISDELAKLRDQANRRYRNVVALALAAVLLLAILGVATKTKLDEQASETAKLRADFEAVAAAISPRPLALAAR